MFIFSPNKYDREFKTIEEVADILYSGNKPSVGHISTSTYTNEIVEYKATNNNSVAGYNGPVHGDVIQIDIDLNMNVLTRKATESKEDIQKLFSEYLKNTMLILGDVLAEWDREGIEYHYGFSGNKGFRLYIPKIHFAGIEKFKDAFNNLCKSATYSLKKKYPTLDNEIFVIDTQPYSKVGMMRAPFTLHEKTNKISYMFFPIEPGKHGSIECYDIIGKDWLKDKALYKPILLRIFKQREDSDKKICLLEEQFTFAEQRVEVHNYDKPYMMESCIWRIWKESSVSTMGRQQTAMRLASWCAKKRFSVETTKTILDEWNDKINHKGPLPPPEILSLLKRYHKYYYNFCKDQVCLEFCPKTKECPYYEPARATQSMLTPHEAIEALDEYDKADQSRVVKWSSIFPGLKGDLNPLFGHIGTIGAASGCYKTQAALTLAAFNDHINWIFWSYEQPEVELRKRLRRIYGLETNPDWKDILEEKSKHIIIVRNGSICAQDRIMMKRQYEMLHNIQISGMISDYAGIIPVRDLDSGKIINGEEQTLPKLPKIIKDNATTEQVIDILLCQPKDQYSANGAVLLEPGHLKYGAILQAASDAQLTLCKPNMLKQNDCLCGYETKNREGHAASTSVIGLKEGILIPELYTGSYTLFRTQEAFLKAAQEGR